MAEDKFTIEAEDGKRIFVYRWLPDEKKKLKCIVQISHGMAEHAGRYKRYAEYMNSIGIGVYANDHRGHGKTAGSLEKVGYFPDKDGWDFVVSDMFLLTEKIRDTHPGIAVFLQGQSMGSFLARDYIARDGSKVDGVILTGTAGDPGIKGSMGILAAKLFSKLLGRRHRDRILDKSVFGSYNKQFKPARTKFDWLTSDESEVDKYISDEYCGGIFTSGFFLYLFTGLKKVNKKENFRSIPNELPIMLISGKKDPLGEDLKGVERVISSFKEAGIKDVEYKFYKSGRHEMLHEINRDEVFTDISEWINSKLKIPVRIG
ncbi:MAG: alpha/beta hydrolase [Candidatus Aminicenantes bacterium]|nr:alpha/beta hydrolase [Candidatus Aminicenantes bacterium]